ncbi:unnamed protein product [Closterium sp. Naga37s-1]|nr:unnamed protein product [Closterium sp. Naga37s-1]
MERYLTLNSPPYPTPPTPLFPYPPILAAPLLAGSGAQAGGVQVQAEGGSVQEKRVSDEDIQGAGLPHTFTTEALGEWLDAAGGEWDIEEGGEADATEESEPAEGVEPAEGSEDAEGSEPEAQCQGVESTAATCEQEKRGLESLVIWLYHKQDDAFFKVFFEATGVTPERDAVKQEHKALIRCRQAEFTAGLDAVRVRVKEIYQIMAPGGDADLAPVDPFDPFSHGICFSVRPPQQQCWRSVADLD